MGYIVNALMTTNPLGIIQAMCIIRYYEEQSLNLEFVWLANYKDVFLTTLS